MKRFAMRSVWKSDFPPAVRVVTKNVRGHPVALSGSEGLEGKLYARGTCDEKGSTPGMIYGLALARDLGLLQGFTAYYFGNMEEWCDGIAPNAFVEVDPKVRPDFVVIGEPTRMQVYRGHKGRLELKIVADGKSADAAHHHLGDNAVYKMINIIQSIREFDRRLGRHHAHPFLGKPTVAVTHVEARTASVNAVPDQFTIYLDRRLTVDEPKDKVLASKPAVQAPDSVVYLAVEEAVRRVNRPEFRQVADLAGFCSSLARISQPVSSAGGDSQRLRRNLPDTHRSPHRFWRYTGKSKTPSNVAVSRCARGACNWLLPTLPPKD